MRCPKCGTDKTANEFYWRRGRPRVSEGCKICYREINRVANRDNLKVQAQLKERNTTTLATARAAHRRWTREEDEILATHYDDPNVELESLAKDLGRTLRSLTCRAELIRHRDPSALQDRRTTRVKNLPTTPAMG